MGIAKYHLRILVLYALVIPLSFVFFPVEWRYGFASDNSGLVILISTCTILGFYYFLRPRKITFSDLRFTQIFSAAIYGIIFAFPEEIIFRGIIQGFLESYFDNPAAAVLFSALVFGTAHLFNGRTGLMPRDWNWRLGILTFFAGLALGLVFALMNSLLFPTLLHAFLLACSKLTKNPT